MRESPAPPVSLCSQAVCPLASKQVGIKNTRGCCAAMHHNGSATCGPHTAVAEQADRRWLLLTRRWRDVHIQQVPGQASILDVPRYAHCTKGSPAVLPNPRRGCRAARIQTMVGCHVGQSETMTSCWGWVGDRPACHVSVKGAAAIPVGFPHGDTPL
jgi:hypothetical protein